jgi:hypothetical protein
MLSRQSGFRDTRRLKPFVNTVVSTANTFIGGVAGNYPTKESLATKLGIPSTTISNYAVVGNNIECNISDNYNLLNKTFYNDSSITYFNDAQGKIIEIDYGAFYGCTSFSYGVFPNVVKISSNISAGTNGTFQNCPVLTSVTAPKFEVVGSTSSNMFWNCPLLNNINFPAYFGSIGSSMFRDCTSLENFIIGGIVGSIGSDGFRNTKIQSLDFTNVTSIGNSAFESTGYCSAVIGHNLTTIGQKAFKLSKVTSLYSTSLSSIDYAAFYSCPELLTVNIPNATTIISNNTGGINGTFQISPKLNSVLAPKVTNITSTNAFNGCGALETIDLSSILTLGSSTANNNVFQNIKVGATITVPTAMATADNGNLEGDLLYARDTRSATIIYV